jgi:hypothetical protein
LHPYLQDRHALARENGHGIAAGLTVVVAVDGALLSVQKPEIRSCTGLFLLKGLPGVSVTELVLGS